MANSSDWLTQAGQAADAGERPAAQPAWITALGLSEAQGTQTTGGFRDISPFAAEPVQTKPQPEIEPEPPSTGQASPEEEAYMRGYAEGHAEAKRVGGAALAAEEARTRDLRLAFRTLDAAGVEALAHDLNATVLTLCESVLGEYALDGEALKARCDAAAKRLGAGPKDLTLHLHPATRASLKADGFPGWLMEDDPSLALGALRLSGLDGEVRDGPEDWTRAIAEALSA